MVAHYRFDEAFNGLSECMVVVCTSRCSRPTILSSTANETMDARPQSTEPSQCCGFSGRCHAAPQAGSGLGRRSDTMFLIEKSHSAHAVAAGAAVLNAAICLLQCMDRQSPWRRSRRSIGSRGLGRGKCLLEAVNQLSQAPHLEIVPVQFAPVAVLLLGQFRRIICHGNSLTLETLD